MRTARLSYEKPSRISQGLVVCFSVAVVVMAGWLAITIMFSRDANIATAADDTNIETTSASPYVDNALPELEKPSVTARLNAAYFEPLPRDYTPGAVTPPRSALPLASFSEIPPLARRDSRYSTSIVPAAPGANYRSIPADEPLPLQTEFAIEAIDAIPDFVPLPVPKPRRISIPVPRPRPHLDGEDQPGPDLSFFDLLINRPR